MRFASDGISATLQQVFRKMLSVTTYCPEKLHGTYQLSAMKTIHALVMGISFQVCHSQDTGFIYPPSFWRADNLYRLFQNTPKRHKGSSKQNIIWFAVLFNAVGVALASMGNLNPIGGAIMHNIGSIAVVLNSSRLIFRKNIMPTDKN